MQIGGKHFEYDLSLFDDGIEFGEYLVVNCDDFFVPEIVTQFAAEEKPVIEVMQELFIAVL
jgi:hypothetical protein